MHLCRVRLLPSFLALGAAVVAAGCGEAALSSPTAPSAVSESLTSGVDAQSGALAATADEVLAALSGQGPDRGSRNGSGAGADRDKAKKDKRDKGRGGDGAEDEGDEADEDERAHAGRRQNLSGVVTAVGADSITLRGIVVKVTPTTVIRHGHRRLALAQVAAGDHAQAKGIMSADGKTLVASEIKVEDTGRDNDDEEEEDDDDAGGLELKGAISAVSGTCPALTFTIGTTSVRTNSSTTFDGVTCAALANGRLVEVTGMRQADGSVLATRVELD